MIMPGLIKKDKTILIWQMDSGDFRSADDADKAEYPELIAKRASYLWLRVANTAAMASTSDVSSDSKIFGERAPLGGA